MIFRRRLKVVVYVIQNYMRGSLQLLKNLYFLEDQSDHLASYPGCKIPTLALGCMNNIIAVAEA